MRSETNPIQAAAHLLALAACAALALRPEIPTSAVAAHAGDAVASLVPGALPATVATALTCLHLRRTGATGPMSMAPLVFLAIAGALQGLAMTVPGGIAANLLSGLAELTAVVLVGGLSLACLAVPGEVGGTVPVSDARVLPFPEPHAAETREPQDARVALAA